MCFCRAQWILKTCSGGLLLTYSFTLFRTFSPSKPAKSLHTQKNRQFFNEPEENFWMVMVFTYTVHLSEFELYSYGWSLPLGIQGSHSIQVIASEESYSTVSGNLKIKLLFGVFVIGGSFKKFWCWDVFKFI